MKVKRLTLGITNCYLIEGSRGYILVDAGSLHKEKKFLRKLKKLKINPRDINLIIITHAHYDHIGSLAGIKQSCQCPVAMSPFEAEITSSGEVVIPPGTNLWGKFVSFVGKRIRFMFKYEPVDIEYKIEQEVSLEDYGVKGRVFPTPGHTQGSLTVLLDDGQAFVGDLAMNFSATGQIYPLFAELPDKVWDSWKELINKGAKRIYPAHGPSFPVERMKKKLA